MMSSLSGEWVLTLRQVIEENADCPGLVDTNGEEYDRLDVLGGEIFNLDTIIQVEFPHIYDADHHLPFARLVEETR